MMRQLRARAARMAEERDGREARGFSLGGWRTQDDRAERDLARKCYRRNEQAGNADARGHRNRCRISFCTSDVPS